MKKFFCLIPFLILIMALSNAVEAQSGEDFSSYPVYKGADLGVYHSQKGFSVKLWAPHASETRIHIYKNGEGGEVIKTLPLQKGENGVWSIQLGKEVLNHYYTLQVNYKGTWLAETPDPYAKAVGVNGKRGMFINLSETNPEGWKADKGPVVKNFTDIILYESHIRDLSIAKNSGIKNKGKYLAFIETGTKSSDGLSTGIDHLVDLGITHIHLLPCFDFNSIDETRLQDNKYNWGYDPLNYNVPEGSFSTNPFDGKVRIKEFKQMVQALHKKGIGVVMDVVYNHTSGLKTPFNLTVPGYYYRQRPDGSLSDASACGNETASERAMMRKFIIESVLYWAREYHIDGFRFDLMGIHDIETMNEVRAAVKKINPSIFIYGEGWTAGSSPLPESIRAVKKNTHLLDGIAAFSDDLRDGLRGPFNNSKGQGFVSGEKGLDESLKFGIAGSVQHPQVSFSKVNYSKAPWAAEPYQTISYVSCHDDPTLFDRLEEANPKVSEEEIIKMDLLAQTVVFTSQGVAFLHSGAEMIRTKKGIHNSYNSPDSINEIDWSRKKKYNKEYTYYRGLISLRKNHISFRLPSADLIRNHLSFFDMRDSLFVGYRIKDVKGDGWKDVIVLVNGDKAAKSFDLPEGEWNVAVYEGRIDEKGIKKVSGKVDVGGTRAVVLFKEK